MPRQPLLVTSSPGQAEAWAAVLDDAGVGALIEIADAQTADPGGSALIGVLGTRPPEFVYVVTVPPDQRKQALAALVESGWDGREGLPGGRSAATPGRSPAPPIRSAILVAIGGVVAFIVLRAIAG